jgi:hypothetical protein
MVHDRDNPNLYEGRNVFQSARRQAFWHDFINLLRGKSTELLNFDDIKARLRLREESYRGIQNIPVDRIVGSVGRYQDFTANFLPRKSTNPDRWSRVYAVVNSLEGVPPIEVYKVDDVYFVRDGNHRVSVARQVGAKTIEAHVTELPTSVDLEPGMSLEDIEQKTGYAAFLEETDLPETRPQHQSLELSEPSRYPELLGHIHLHRSFLEQIRKQAVDLKEAAADWYDNVYRPAVALVRKHGLLEQMPDRTEADLFLWMVDHLREVREEFGDEAESRSFSDAAVDFLTERHLPIPKELLVEKDKSVLLTKTQVLRAVEIARKREKKAAEGDPTAE